MGKTRPARAKRAGRHLAALPAARRHDLRLKDAFFRRVAAEVARTGNARIVKAMCEHQSRQMKGRRGFSWLRLYNQYFAWLKAHRDVAALVTGRGTGAKVDLRMLGMVAEHAINEALSFATACKEMMQAGAALGGMYEACLRHARRLGYLDLIARARAVHRERARIEAEHESMQRRLDGKLGRLLRVLDRTAKRHIQPDAANEPAQGRHR